MFSTNILFLLDEVELLNTKTFPRDSYNQAKFLLEYNNDITNQDVQQNCSVDKTNRTKTNDFLTPKCQFMYMPTTVYNVL